MILLDLCQSDTLAEIEVNDWWKIIVDLEPFEEQLNLGTICE
jgi:hypothetical protein